MAKHLHFWLGVFVTSLLSVPIAVGIWGASAEWAQQAAVFIFGMLISLHLVLVAVLLFRDRILRKLMGTSEATLDEVSKNAFAALSAATSGNKEEALHQSGLLVRSGLNWYSWSAFYRWVIGTAAAILLSFGALTGTVLLFEQNRKIGQQTALLASQNSHLRDQTKLFENQNELVGLSLVSELRGRLTSSGMKSVEWPTVPIDEDPYEWGTCKLHREFPRLSLPANQSEVNAILNLANSKVIGDRVINALISLLKDSDSSVRFAVTTILSQVDEISASHLEIPVTQLKIDGMYLDNEDFPTKIEISFSNSFVKGFNCPDCTVSALDSVFFGLASTAFNQKNSINEFENLDDTAMFSWPKFILDSTLNSAVTTRHKSPFDTSTRIAIKKIGRDKVVSLIGSQWDLDRNPCTVLESIAKKNQFVRFERFKSK